MKFRWLYTYYLGFTSVVRIYNTTSCSILKVCKNYGIGKHLFHRLLNKFLWTRQYETPSFKPVNDKVVQAGLYPGNVIH